MIEFNKNLESIGQSLSAVSRLKKHISYKSTEQLISIVSTLDSDRKGYLTHFQIYKYPTKEFLIYLNAIFQQRISYSALVSYLQSQEIQNVDEMLGMCQISGRNVGQYLMSQHLLVKLKKQIENNLKKYMVGTFGKVQYEEFENYCHSQRLGLNPKIIFKFLSNNRNSIDIHENEIKVKKIKIKNREETLERIKTLQGSLQRLNQRVQKFGSQWL